MALAFGNPRLFASEASALPHTVYNTALEHHLRDRLGVRFADRRDIDPGKRPVREIVGVDPALNQRWSTRRVLIKDRQGELAAPSQRDHGRPPTPVEALLLAQQATLETRDPNLAGQPEPPLRFAAGADAVATFERRANNLLAQANAYRDLSSSLAIDSD